MDTQINLALWNYFWSDVDGEKAESRQEMRTLKMLSSIGYNTAFAHLRKHLGDCFMHVDEQDEESDSWTLDIDLKSVEFESISDLATLAADSQPAVFDCDVDSEGVVSVDYLTLPPDYEEKLLHLSSEEEDDDSSSIEDTVCFAYNYGGPEVENTEGWDRLGLLPDPWAEARHPTVEMITPDDLKADEVEPELNTLTLASGLGNLALTPDFKGYGYTKIQLPSKGIKSVELLQHYPYLQYVDLANNKIEDPSPLWSITHLVVLDLSNNNLSDGSIKNPDQIGFLTYLNLSHNKFNKIPDFSNCWAIKHFDLAQNQIERIEHLSELKYLSYLNLSHNKLEFIENLDNKLLKEVNFSYNSISRWENPGPKEIHSMENINISYNQLPTLTIFAEMYNLNTLDVSYNKISAMSEFDALKTLPVVTNLKIAGNQINTIIPDPRRLIIYLIPSIKVLDGVPISSMERVSSVSIFTGNPVQHMICQSMRSLYYSYTKNPTVGWERLKLTGEHPAFIMLIGDIGSSRKIIIDMVQRMNPHICKGVKITTSRPQVKGEKLDSRMQYISLKKFNTIEKEGGFFVVERRLGHKFGIAVRELEDKNKVLLSFMGMRPSLEALWRGYNPTLIIMLPNREDVLTERCVKWFLSSDVYRTMFKVRRVPKRKRGGSEQSEDTIVDDSEIQIRDIPKKRVKLIKCRSMFSTSGRKKWKIKKYTENLGLNKQILEECYGKYLSSTPATMMKSTWYDTRATTSHVSFLDDGLDHEHSTDIQGSLRGSQTSMSEENELRRFVKNIFQNQMDYRMLHIKNPGLFELFISSDDIEKAAHALFGVVKNLYAKLIESKKVKTIDLQSDPNYKSMVEEPLMELVNEVTSHDLPLDIAI